MTTTDNEPATAAGRRLLGILSEEWPSSQGPLDLILAIEQEAAERASGGLDRLAEVLESYRLSNSEYFAPNIAPGGDRLQNAAEWASEIAARLATTQPGEPTVPPHPFVGEQRSPTHCLLFIEGGTCKRPPGDPIHAPQPGEDR